MEINEIIANLKDKFGENINVEKAKELLSGMDTHKLSFNEIVEKMKTSSLIGDLDGDGKQEGIIDELKGKASKMFGSVFGK